MRPLIPSPNRIPHKPSPKYQNHSSEIVIENIINNMPYSCIVDIACPPGIDSVYYAALDSKGEKLFYKSERPSDLLPSFSIYDMKKGEKQTEEKEFTFICWPVNKGKIGKPTKIGPLPIYPKLKLGTYDLEGNFSGEDTLLFQQVKPLIEKHYGKAALPGPVKVTTDRFDIFFPSHNTIKLSSDKRNFIHELVHTSRKRLLFAMKKGRYHQATEMIEEFFAEGVANFVKDDLNKTPNTHLQEGAVYGSTMGYNYDFRIQDPSVRTQDLQSTSGGIVFLETTRYYLASEAYHKVALEYFMDTGRYYGKDFNEVYYYMIQDKKQVPNKELFFQITSAMVPTIENIETNEWLKQQKIFDCEKVVGEKIYMDFNDYPMHDEWLGICQFYCYETFENGSDWAIGEKRYNKNGAALFIEIKEVSTGQKVFSKTCHTSHFPNGFGFVKIYFYHKDQSPGVQHFMAQDQQSNTASQAIYVESGLYEITVTTQNAKRIYYHFMGETMLHNRDKLLFAYPKLKQNAKIQVKHTNKEKKEVTSEVAQFTNQRSLVALPIVENKNCEPGILQIAIEKEDGSSELFHRNIGYGSSHGGHQFLLDNDI